MSAAAVLRADPAAAPTDLALAKLCEQSYDDSAIWDRVWTWAGVHVMHKRVADTDVVVFRGTAEAEDWMRDLDAMVPRAHPDLGICPSGFVEDIDKAFAEVMLEVPSGNLVVTGHSLGAARALLFAGIGVTSRIVLPRAVVTFGSPRPGRAQLTRILSGLPMRSYKHRHDPVPDVPPFFEHPSPLIQLSPAAGIDDDIEDHFMASYVAALSQ